VAGRGPAHLPIGTRSRRPAQRGGELAADGSELALERGSLATSRLLDQARDLPAIYQLTSLWKGGLGADVPGWLTRHGWCRRSPKTEEDDQRTSWTTIIEVRG
jgi:hypothetical protein